jgi:hypothetical protein
MENYNVLNGVLMMRLLTLHRRGAVNMKGIWGKQLSIEMLGVKVINDRPKDSHLVFVGIQIPAFAPRMRSH